MSKETHSFRVVSNLDNYTKDTLEKETGNDELIVSVIIIKATPLIVLMQDKLVAVYDFATSILDDITVNDDEINEVKAAQLVKIIVPFSWSTKVSQLNATAVASLSSSKASLAISRATTTFINNSQARSLTRKIKKILKNWKIGKIKNEI